MALLPLPSQSRPLRLVIALDGIAYRDLQALQAGITRTNFFGRTRSLRAFTAAEGYYPVSRMISTFPSASDVAWTDIFGDRPLPGYQRTYFSAAANSMISINGVTTTMEHERQMDWQEQNGFLRAMGYLFPAHMFKREMRGTVDNFWRCTNSPPNYYVYIRASDDAQHLDRDIMALLCQLDEELQGLRARYRAAAGHDLQIVILSDHGHNHAGRGIRVNDGKYLEAAGYHVASTIADPKDVVLPVVGIESWIEVHCAPAATAELAQSLIRLPGVDLLTARVFPETNRFMVVSPDGVRADIWWNAAQNSYRYAPVTGDPLRYQSVVDALKANGRLDSSGFATADDWMAATMTNYYPLAPERIVRGLTRGALNPATILISLNNRYVNDYWLTDLGSRLVTCRSTHGGLDAICSDGIVLSNFQRTHDTSTDRVAGQFDDFPGVRDFRRVENGGELITKSEQKLTRIPRVPLDNRFVDLPDGGLYLRVWSPALSGLDPRAALAVTVKKKAGFFHSRHPLHFEVDPVSLPGSRFNERLYRFPANLQLEPAAEYVVSGRAAGQMNAVELFEFSVHTTPGGRAAAF